MDTILGSIGYGLVSNMGLKYLGTVTARNNTFVTKNGWIVALIIGINDMNASEQYKEPILAFNPTGNADDYNVGGFRVTTSGNIESTINTGIAVAFFG